MHKQKINGLEITSIALFWRVLMSASVSWNN